MNELNMKHNVFCAPFDACYWSHKIPAAINK